MRPRGQRIGSWAGPRCWRRSAGARGDGGTPRERKRAGHAGPGGRVFEPLELLERLAAMTPRPETNLLICHGLLAARARWRARVVAYGRVAPEPTASAPAVVAGAEGT